MTFVRIHGVRVDHWANKYPTFTASRGLCGVPATPTAAYVKPDPRRGEPVTEWQDERVLCRTCARLRAKWESRCPT